MKLQRVSAAEREQVRQQVAQVHQFREQRLMEERAGARAIAAGGGAHARPRPMNLPHSPIAVRDRRVIRMAPAVWPLGTPSPIELTIPALPPTPAWLVGMNLSGQPSGALATRPARVRSHGSRRVPVPRHAGLPYARPRGRPTRREARRGLHARKSGASRTDNRSHRLNHDISPVPRFATSKIPSSYKRTIGMLRNSMLDASGPGVRTTAAITMTRIASRRFAGDSRPP